MPVKLLKYYINLGAPPIRDYASDSEPFLRPEVGFNPSWFHKFCGIDFSERWHTDIPYRLESHEKMAAEIKRRFPGYNIGEVLDDKPVDLLTGIFGIGVMDSILGRELHYEPHMWPAPVGEPLTDEDINRLEVPDLSKNEFFQSILAQVEKIHALTGSARGFLNWQGNLNTAFRLRGTDIFSDLLINRPLVEKLLHVISETFLQGVKLLHARQKELGTEYHFGTIANCTVNMAGPKTYEDVLLKHDIKIASQFEVCGVHNCAWTATPYLESYSKVPNVGYIDMGIETDLAKAREVFPRARRNCLYKSIDLGAKTKEEIRRDFELIAENLAPCDIGMPDIDHGVPDEKIMYAVDLCKEFSDKHPVKRPPVVAQRTGA